MKALREIDLGVLDRYAQSTWAGNPALRAEFGDKRNLFDIYLKAVASGAHGAADHPSIGPITKQHLSDHAANLYCGTISGPDNILKRHADAMYWATQSIRMDPDAGVQTPAKAPPPFVPRVDEVKPALSCAPAPDTDPHLSAYKRELIRRRIASAPATDR